MSKKRRKQHESKAKPRSYTPFSICLIVLFFVTAIILRIVLPFDSVFVGNEVRLTEPDCYYHLRLAERIQNGEDITQVDPLLQYPVTKGNVPVRPLLSDLIVYGSNLTHQSLDVVAAVLPALMGVVIVCLIGLVTYFTFGLWAGILAFGLATFSPGEFLNRTRLGYSDHHVLEILLTVLILLFIILSFKKSRWFLIGTGISLGLAQWNWNGAFLIVGILLVYYVIQSVVNQWQEKSNFSLYLILNIPLFISFLMMWFNPIYSKTLYIPLIMFVCCTSVLVIYGVSIFIKNKVAYPIALIISGLVIFGIIKIIIPVQFDYIFYQLRLAVGFYSGGQSTTVSEVRPLFMPDGKTFSLAVAFGNYGICFVVALLGMIALIKKKLNESTLLILTMCVVLFGLAIGCPEDITRSAWHQLTKKQQDKANAKADKATPKWFNIVFVYFVAFLNMLYG